MINSFIKSYYNLDYKNLFYILKNRELMSLNDFEIIVKYKKIMLILIQHVHDKKTKIFK